MAAVSRIFAALTDSSFKEGGTVQVILKAFHWTLPVPISPQLFNLELTGFYVAAALQFLIYINLGVRLCFLDQQIRQQPIRRETAETTRLDNKKPQANVNQRPRKDG